MKKNKHKSKNKNKVSNKIIILAATLLMVSILGIMGLNAVYAALTDYDEKTNDLQVANLKGEITEKFTPPTKDKPIKPGEPYPKEVKVINSRNAPFFVRSLVVPEIQSSDGFLLPSEIGKEIIVDLNKDWILGEVGFYYYLKKVPKGKETSPIFTTVTLSGTLPSNGEYSYNDASMSISLKSETVTSAGDNYRKAWWQGKVPTDKNLKLVDDALQVIIKEGK